jgi:uncharacterized protein
VRLTQRLASRTQQREPTVAQDPQKPSPSRPGLSIIASRVPLLCVRSGPRVQRFTMRAAIASLLMVCSAGASCDKRPEEPPGRRQVPKTAEGTVADVFYPGLPAPVPSSTPSRERCVEPLAAQAPPVAPAAARCPLDPVFGGVHLATARIQFPAAPRTPQLEVELATTADQQERGLMYRTQMPENSGMLFPFGAPSVHTFWMHNTCIPLDMLFIAEDGFITGILENVPTLNDAARSIPCPVSYVLEVNAGWSRRHGVAPGQRVQLPR